MREVANTDFFGLGHVEFAVEQVGRNQKFVIAIGVDLDLNTVQLNELLYSLVAHLGSLGVNLASDAPPTLGDKGSSVHGLDMHEAYLLAR